MVINRTVPSMTVKNVYCNKWYYKWHLFYDNIIDSNKWHFNRFLNQWLHPKPLLHSNFFGKDKKNKQSDKGTHGRVTQKNWED
jgi:hypothetical protein